MIDRHVFLIGMPGSGKSSLGKRCAADMHLPFIDMDQQIVEIFGCSVGDIFAKYGEEAFRTAETNLLRHISREEPGIISTGGGTVVREINRELMRNQGLILFIDRPLA